MKLYFAPGACSMASHIALNEAGINHEMEKVDLKTHTYGDGKDFYKVNPKGYVPALILDDGDLLTENAVVLQYICDQQPSKNLMPPAGTKERYRAMEWIHFLATEIHKTQGVFFNPKAPEEQKKQAHELLPKKFAILAKALDNSDFLMGSQISAPDF